MAEIQVHNVLHYLRRINSSEATSGISDSELLHRFAAKRDEMAFELLVWRYSKLVLGVCRRLLPNLQDAEDAFQATFHTLVRKAHAIRKRGSVGSWLYKVAYRSALELRTRTGRRARRELPMVEPVLDAGLPDPCANAGWNELRLVVDEEVSRLPEKYRLPLALCCLGGKSTAEAARELNCPVGTLESRLTRARQRLRARLLRRGFPIATGVTAAALVPSYASAASSLVSRTVHDGMLFASGRVAEVASAHAVAVAERVLQTMLLAKIKCAAAAVVLVSVLGTSGLFLARAAVQRTSNSPEPLSAHVASISEIYDTAATASGGRPKVARDEPTAFDFQARDFQSFPREIWTAAFTPDGKALVSVGGLWDQPGQVQMIDLATGKVRWRTEHPLGVRGLAISRDGKMLVTADYQDNTAKIRDPETGAVRHVLRAGAGVNHVALSPDGKLLATAGLDNIVRVWDLETREVVRTMELGPGGVFCVAFSPDGKTLAGAGGELAVRLWDVASGVEKLALRGHPTSIEYVAFAPDGVTLATASWDKTIKLWSLPDGKELATLEGHTLPLLSIAFSPDGALLASSSGKWNTPDLPDGPGEVKLWDVQTRRELASFSGHENRVWGVAFSPNGKVLASASWDRTVKLWAVAGRKLLKTLPVDTGPRLQPQPVLALARSSDGKLLAVAAEDKTVRLHSVASGEVRSVLQGHEDVVTALAFSPDRNILATGGPDKLIKLWDTATAKELRTFTGHTNWIYALAFSPDGKVLASGGYDKVVRLWEAVTGKELGQLPGHKAAVRSLAFNANGQMLASAGGDKTVRLWDVARRASRHVLKGHDGNIRAIAFSPDGQLVGSASEDGTVKLWDAATGKERHTLKGHIGEVWSLVFSPQGQTLATGAGDVSGLVILWDTETGQQRSQLRGHRDAVSGIAFVLSGKELITASADGTLKRWGSNSELVRQLVGHTGPVLRAAFSPDGSRILSTGGWPYGDGTVRLWDSASAKELRRWQLKVAAAPAGNKCVAFAPDGRHALFAGDGGVVYFWDLDNDKEIRRFTGHKGTINSLCFTPDGRRFLSAGEDRIIRLYDVGTGKVLRSYDGHSDRVRCLALSPDGRRFASGGRDNTIHLWDIDSAQSLRRFDDNAGWVETLVFARDGRRLFAGAGNSIRLLDLVTGKELRRLAGHQGAVNSIALSPDGRWLVSGGYDASVRLWDAARGSEVHVFRGHRNWVWSVAFAPDGRHILSAGGGAGSDAGYVAGDDFALRLWALPTHTASGSGTVLAPAVRYRVEKR
jgi:RNA polymerase sigma factor (sigma-70 family)